MTLAEFDRRMNEAAQTQRQGYALLVKASEMVLQAYNDAGLVCDSREPGFPCWILKTGDTYYSTAREAIAASESPATEASESPTTSGSARATRFASSSHVARRYFPEPTLPTITEDEVAMAIAVTAADESAT